MSQSNISLAQQAIDMDVAYVDAEEEWKDSYTICQKQLVSQTVLRWCKKNWATFVLIELYDEPESIIELDNWVDVEKYQEEWKDRITVWRNRFNEVHSSV